MGAKPECQVKNYYFTKKALRIINNQSRNRHLGQLFKKGNNILKCEDKILIGNIIFIGKTIISYRQFSKIWLLFCSETHNYDTVLSPTDKLFKRSYRINSYGKNYYCKCY